MQNIWILFPCIVIFFFFQKKCHPYYPQSGLDEEMEYDDVGLKVSLLEESYLNYFTVRKIELEDMEVRCQKPQEVYCSV